MERKLFSPGRYSDDHVTLVAENDKMVWAETGFHERYINKDYSIVKLFDFKSGKTKKLTSKTRYFSPAISKDGRMIFVTETDEMNRYFYVLLDAAIGKIIARTPTPEQTFLTHPRWMADNIHVVCISLSEKGNALVKLNIHTGEMELLLPYGDIPLSRPFPMQEVVYFSGGFGGTNNIYALDTDTKQLFRVTSVRFGAFEPVVSNDGKTLAFSEYTADGYQIKSRAITRMPPFAVMLHLE